ncbi:unnamed protein product [Spirodela intermedia]|nr:unnamed protein product [Spirodela intermedia]CAA6666598.1 unnamed protein product [Spirodela intermedia]
MSEETARRVGSATNPENPISRAASTEYGNQSFHSRDDSCNHGVLSVEEGLRVLNGDLHLTSMQESYRKVVLQHNSRKTEIRTGQDRLQEYLESGFNSRAPEKEMASFPREAGSSLKSERPEAYSRINGKVVDGRETQMVDFRENAVKLEFQTVADDQQSKCDVGAENKASSSSPSAGGKTGSSEEEFNRVVKRGAGLLRQAGECLKGQNDEQTAEIFLYKSARLLSTAVAMKPGSLLALGQLGNTRLLHGELKLKISRDLRTLLSRNGPSFTGKKHHQSRSDEQSFLKKEKMVSALVDVCEECEELLIDAGRNYKMVLSIDENDVRALYNWGLALSFRAELIADAGPDAATDADKVYLAAIEKFDAMMSRTGDYASDALFRWGVALRRRSQLRPRGSSEKVKLLRQAKSLFEDVLRVDAENSHVREALRSCISELRLR